MLTLAMTRLVSKSSFAVRRVLRIRESRALPGPVGYGGRPTAAAVRIYFFGLSPHRFNCLSLTSRLYRPCIWQQPL